MSLRFFNRVTNLICVSWAQIKSHHICDVFQHKLLKYVLGFHLVCHTQVHLYFNAQLNTY